MRTSNSIDPVSVPRVFLSFHLLITVSTSCQVWSPLPQICKMPVSISRGFCALTRFVVGEREPGSLWPSQSSKKTSFPERTPLCLSLIIDPHPFLYLELNPSSHPYCNIPIDVILNKLFLALLRSVRINFFFLYHLQLKEVVSSMVTILCTEAHITWLVGAGIQRPHILAPIQDISEGPAQLPRSPRDQLNPLLQPHWLNFSSA